MLLIINFDRHLCMLCMEAGVKTHQKFYNSFFKNNCACKGEFFFFIFKFTPTNSKTNLPQKLQKKQNIRECCMFHVFFYFFLWKCSSILFYKRHFLFLFCVCEIFFLCTFINLKITFSQ